MFQTGKMYVLRSPAWSEEKATQSECENNVGVGVCFCWHDPFVKGHVGVVVSFSG